MYIDIVIKDHVIMFLLVNFAFACYNYDKNSLVFDLR